MKKLLALVLALVMSMSLVTISNAAFSDADKISHDEAVDVLNTLGVINGMPDGSYNPAGNVTRAEMAKMISIIMLGDVDASAFVGTATGLTDIKGHWAEGYIQYCYSQGIIAGRGDGTFAPNANVTTVEAAKMLLGAIGYNATVQGYTGADWAINVTRDAQVSGFFEDLKGLGSAKALNRDEAAQMIYNAVVADLIVKTPVLNVTTGTLQYEYRPDPAKSLLTETFGAVKVEGYVVANEYAALSDSSTALKAGKTEIVVSNHDENKIWGNAAGTASETFNVSTGADELGKTVVMYVKPAASSTNAARATVLGKAFLSSDNVVATTNGSFSKASKLDDFLKDAGLKTSLANVPFFKNGVLANGTISGGVVTVSSAFAYTNAAKGYTTQFIDNNNNGYVDYILQTAYDFGKVTTYSDAKETIVISTSGTPIRKTDKEDVVGFDKVAKDDYVLYATIGGLLYVEKAQTATGKITAYSIADKTYSLSGTSYNWSGATAPAGDTKAVIPSATLSFVDATFYLDKAGNVVAYDSTAANQYCLVIGYEAAGGGTDLNEHVLVALPDGTTAKYIFDSSDTTNNTVLNGATATNIKAATVANSGKAVLCKYTLTSDGEIYLKENLNSSGAAQSGLTTDVATTGLKFTKGNSLIYDGTDVEYKYVNDSTVFYIVTTKTGGTNIKDVDVYTGAKNVPSFDLGNTTQSIAMINSDGNIEAIAIVCAADETGVGTAADFMYVVKYLNTYDGYTEAVVIKDGSVQTVKIDKGITTTGLVKFSTNSDGEFEKLTSIALTEDTKTIARVTEKSIVVNNKEYEITDKTQIALLDGKDSTMMTLSELRKNDTVLVYDEPTADGKAEAVYVVEQYDPANAALLAYATDANVTAYNASTKTLTVASTSVTYDQVKAVLTVSAKATLHYSASQLTTVADASAATELAGSSTVANNSYVYIVSESGTEMTELKIVTA